jgi:hypothetical protein
MRMTLPPRAATSCILETVLLIRCRRRAITITGTVLSISAIGPCFSSPAAQPPAWMYDISLTLRAPLERQGIPCPAPEKEHVAALGQLPRQRLDIALELQYLVHEPGDVAELPHKHLLLQRRDDSARRAGCNCQTRENGALTCKCFCRCHSDFRACQGRHHDIVLAGEGRCGNIYD